jgi:hypothetical protein
MLRWRRARRAIGGLRHEPSRLATAVVSQPHWHLHLAHHTVIQANRRRAAGAAAMPTLRQLRSAAVDRQSGARDGAPRAAAEPPVHRLRAARAREERSDEDATQTPRLGVSSAVLVRRAERVASSPALGRVQSRRVQSSAAADVKTMSVTAARAFPATTARRRVGAPPAAFAGVPHRSVAPSIVWRNAARATDARVREMPPARMTWRALPQASSSDHEVFTRRKAPSTVMTDMPVTIAAREPTSRAAAQSSLSSVQATDLDQRTIDRLADDVIRRVERRSRIERERRGV